MLIGIFIFFLLIILLKVHFSPSDDWDKCNLVANGDFMIGKLGELPDGWEAICPNPKLAPIFRLVESQNNGRALFATGNGRRECFGYVRHAVHFDAGKTYRLRVRLRFDRMDDINKHLVHCVFSSFNNGIFDYSWDGDWVVGENRFPTSDKPSDGEVRLYFRFSPNGKVWWDKVSLQECEPIPQRIVRIACSWGKEDMSFWTKWLDRVGEKKVDVALLPEMFNGKPVKETETIDGPSPSLLAEKAKKWKMYVSGSFYEKRDDLVFNTAPLFDREGRLVGTYEKNQLYDPEEDDGATPGVGYPVFQTDFGKVGIIICYDSWFPETARLLAYKGAELILLPNAGYFRGLMPARSADNGVWIAVSSLGRDAGVWDSSGMCAGEVESDPTRNSPSSILEFEKDEKSRILIATVDLNRRYSPAWWGGPMRSAPGGRRLRQTLIVPIEDEIAYEAKRWLKP